MAETGRYLTFDFGAESGRAVLGVIERGRMSLTEVRRFPNEPQWLLGRYHWDTVRLFAELKAGLAAAAREASGPIDGIGVDTWGVDYALLDASNELLGLPYHYRDPRTDGMLEEAFARVPRAEIYRATGIQFMQINTLYQLLSTRLNNARLLDSAATLLFTPDLLNFWLTGRKSNELTISTTSQCYDPILGRWASSILDRLEIPTEIFQAVVPPGTVLGPLDSSVARDCGCGSGAAAGVPPVIAPATHDTGSAVAAVPASGGNGWAYISCGTWSLVGVEVDRPVVTDQSLAFNLTNEGGVAATTRLLRNVMGLWLLQQCRRAWERQGRAYSYEELASLADQAAPFAALLDPDDPSFLNPTDMPAAIGDFCRRTRQPPPENPAAMARCIVESLALKYRWVLERLEEVTGRQIETVHIIGGGSRHHGLCQATADATGRRVLAGPVEATAAGNVLVQAIATGRLANVAEGRALVRASFPLAEYTPRGRGAWDAPYERLTAMLPPL